MALTETASELDSQPEPTASEKNWGMLAHISVLIGLIVPLGNFLAPLIVAAIHRKSAYVFWHARTALNFQISVLLYMLLIGVLGAPPLITAMTTDDGLANAPTWMLLLALTAVLCALALLLLEVIFVLVASVRAVNGSRWRYPFLINFWRGKDD